MIFGVVWKTAARIFLISENDKNWQSLVRKILFPGFLAKWSQKDGKSKISGDWLQRFFWFLAWIGGPYLKKTNPAGFSLKNLFLRHLDPTVPKRPKNYFSEFSRILSYETSFSIIFWDEKLNEICFKSVWPKFSPILAHKILFRRENGQKSVLG